jgi:hypothetical protein
MFYSPITVPVTFAINQSQSGNLSVGGITLLGVLMPAAWTAANLTLLASNDGTNFFPIHTDGGTELTVTAAQGQFIRLPVGLVLGAPFIRFRSGTTATPVNQAAARTLQLYARQMT